jgi:transcriptional regulator with XRE-family HTH domain
MPRSSTSDREAPYELELRTRALYLELGRRIRQRREAKELKQEELATRAAISRSSIANIERGQQQAPVHVLFAIAGVLDVELADLLPTRSEVDAGVAAGRKVHKVVTIGGEASRLSGDVTLLIADLLRPPVGPVPRKPRAGAARKRKAS